MKRKKIYAVDVCRYGNGVIVLLLAVYFFLMPFGLLVYYLSDPALKGAGVCRFAVDLHEELSPRYEKWARERVAGQEAEGLSTHQIAETEWPMFGSMFYLWATESFQQVWDKDEGICEVAPKEYVAGAIEAAAALVVDPGHASWVKEHWGEKYLERENVFYRMLLISSCVSYENLLGGGKYKELLRSQAGSLAAELERSPYGILDDYPFQCFPTDVVAAIAAIRRADGVLGTDSRAFVERSLRGFEGQLVDEKGLPSYMAIAQHGECYGGSRGCSNAWGLYWAPYLWPDTAKDWYARHEKHFWQERYGIAGFREFGREITDKEWHFDVDAGPVVAGFGVSAGAYGMGAARANGRFDHAYPLSGEIIVMSWPLLDGTLLTSRILSNAGHAPFLGDAGLVFNFMHQPAEGVTITKGGKLPMSVYLVLCVYLIVGILLVVSTIFSLRRWRKKFLPESTVFGKMQLVVWFVLLVVGTVVMLGNNLAIGAVVILLGQFLPKGVKKKVKLKGRVKAE